MLENYGVVILITIIILVAGGLISYVGDIVGTRIGKRRLSLWGMRPRHTATFSTVVAGCLISGFTLAALIVWDSSVRRALLQGRQIVTANRSLNEQNAALRHQNAALTTTQQTAAQNADIAQQQAKDAQNEAKIAVNQTKTAQTRLKASRQLLQAEQQKVRAAAAQIALAQSKIAQAEAQISKARTQVAGIKHEGQKLLAANKILANTYGTLVHSTADLRLSRQFIYHNGDELGRRVIQTHQSPALIYDELRHFLHDLGQQALQNHGQVGTNGHAVTIFTPVQVKGKMAIIPEDESLKALAQGISERPLSISSVVVIAQAAFNTLPGEQTRIQLHPYKNLMVFPKDAPIASAEINGDEPQGKTGDRTISDALEDFLIDSVQPAARAHGIIPRIDPVTGKPSYGATIDSTNLIQQVRQAGIHAHVTATAAQDTYAAGPLVVNLSVSP